MKKPDCIGWQQNLLKKEMMVICLTFDNSNGTMNVKNCPKGQDASIDGLASLQTLEDDAQVSQKDI